MADGEDTTVSEVGELGTGRAEDDDGNEAARGPEPGIVGGGDQGGHPGSLGGEPAPAVAAGSYAAEAVSHDTTAVAEAAQDEAAQDEAAQDEAAENEGPEAEDSDADETEDEKDEDGDDEEERERFYSDLDWDDIAEAFIGSLLAGLVILAIVGALRRGRRGRH